MPPPAATGDAVVGTGKRSLCAGSPFSFGRAKYQNTDAPLTFWIDEVAIDASRIGRGS